MADTTRKPGAANAELPEADLAGALIGSDNNAAATESQAAAEQIQPGLKKTRGMSQASLDMIERMRAIASDVQPITGRGIGYKLFTAGLIDSMSTNEMQKVYRLLRIAREQGDIPWEWIVDETRELERVATWSDPEEYARCVARSYRRDFWDQQPNRVIVASEKGTIRGVLRPVLDDLAVGFQVMHGFASATVVNDLAQDDDGRPLILLYVGDFDPSGLYMSEEDLPRRLSEYGGNHIVFRRVALTPEQLGGLPFFWAEEKRTDKRYKWFVERHGDRCWELDAMDPRALRDYVAASIWDHIEPDAWEHCERINAAETESLQTILTGWRSITRGEA
jgi:hypothetical protein